MKNVFRCPFEFVSATLRMTAACWPSHSVEAQIGSAGATLRQTVAFDVSGNDANENPQRDSSLRGRTFRKAERGEEPATPTQNDAGLQNAAMVCVTV